MTVNLERTIRKDFPALGDQWVVILNPALLPGKKVNLRPVRRVEGNLDETDFSAALHECAAGLVIDWHVYDMSQAEGKPPLIPLEECNAVTLDERVAHPITSWIIDRRVEAMRPPSQSQEPSSSIPG